MIPTTHNLFSKGKPVSLRPQMGMLGQNSLKPAQESVHFSGDPFKIFNRLNDPDTVFKKIADTIVWKQDNDTLNVAEMLVFLCKKRPKDNYPGYAKISKLEQCFPGLDSGALKKAFDSIVERFQGHKKNELLYRDSTSCSKDPGYELTRKGLEKIKKLYPEIKLPPIEEIQLRV
ncbi:MAG: hypothetical protein K2X66_14590 [Cyanobacteria bacterium]|nr:hypothetical protein [Cyanobacteriota bacterium]